MLALVCRARNAKNATSAVHSKHEEHDDSEHGNASLSDFALYCILSGQDDLDLHENCHDEDNLLDDVEACKQEDNEQKDGEEKEVVFVVV